MGLGLMTSERLICVNKIHFSDCYHLNIHNTTTLLIRAVHAIGGLIAPWWNSDVVGQKGNLCSMEEWPMTRFAPSYRLSMPMHWPSLPGWKLYISKNWTAKSLPASELSWGATGDLDRFHLKSRLKRKLTQNGRLSYWSFWITLVLYNGGEVKLMDTKEEGRLRSFAHLGGGG